ncbi:MAG: hypothetical protein GY928_16995 [Colwellia sp.]|nr:hypothetical protein [Colwellia sp.]
MTLKNKIIILPIFIITPLGIFGSINKDSKYKNTLIPVNSEIRKNHIQKVTNGKGPRNFSKIPELKRVSDYIYEQFEQIGLKPQFQSFNVKKDTFKNVIAIIGNKHNKKIVERTHRWWLIMQDVNRL